MHLDGRSSGPRRVVALLTAFAPAPDVPAGWELARTACGYEAAAELVTRAGAALVVDLGKITSSHVPLLELAARLQVPVVAFGTISAALPADVMAALTLVGADQVQAALEALLAGPAEDEPAPAAPVEAVEPAVAAAEVDPAPVEATPAPVEAVDPPAGPETLPPEPIAADAPEEIRPTDRPAPPAELAPLPPAEHAQEAPPSQPLTQAELDALLEDDP